MKLIFATANKNKVAEVRALLNNVQLLSLADINYTKDIPEPYPSLQENAQHKALTIYQAYHTACFADDTGLEVPALNNEPGVLSARYAGEQKNAADNIELLLQKLAHATDAQRKAHFRTVVSLYMPDGSYHEFEGIVKGTITNSTMGAKGFGYDPVFMPEGYQQTFAQMGMATKNAISHRGKAIAQLVTFLNSYTA